MPSEDPNVHQDFPRLSGGFEVFWKFQQCWPLAKWFRSTFWHTLERLHPLGNLRHEKHVLYELRAFQEESWVVLVRKGLLNLREHNLRWGGMGWGLEG